MSIRVSLMDAVRKVEALSLASNSSATGYGMSTCLDSSASQIPTGSITKHFEDGFDCRRHEELLGRHVKTAKEIESLDLIVAQGHQMVNMLYSHRCCSKAIPQIKSEDRETVNVDRVEMHTTIVEVMKPEISKLFELLYYVRHAAGILCERVATMCAMCATRKQTSSSSPPPSSVNDDYLATLAKLLNALACIDEMKNLKSSIKNDFSTYRRSLQFINASELNGSLPDSQSLSIFLANNDVIRSMISDHLNKGVIGYEDAICDIVNICLQHLTSDQYILAEEKYCYIRTIGFCLSLLDNERVSIYKLDAKKKLSLEKIDKVFSVCSPVIPLCGDMQSAAFTSYVSRSKNFDRSKWPECCKNNNGYLSGSALPSTRKNSPPTIDIPAMQTTYREVMSELSRWASFGRGSQRTIPADHLAVIALNALKTLSNWQSNIMSLYAWKVTNPILEENDAKLESYDRAIRYNLSEVDKRDLSMAVWMLKSLERALCDRSTQVAMSVNLYINLHMIKLVECVQASVTSKLSKKRKDISGGVLLALLDLCQQMAGCRDRYSFPMIPTFEAVTSNGMSNGSDMHFDVTINKLNLIKSLVQSLLNDKSVCCRRTLRRDVDTNLVTGLLEFQKHSKFWTHLIDFKASLTKCCQLSDLWFREFYLEMSRNDRVQYQLESSLIWILADHVMESPELTECLFYLLSLYNDSSNAALLRFKKQHLFEEIEDEAQACCEAVCEKMSRKLWSHYKVLAGCLLLDKRYRYDCETRGVKINFPTERPYASVLRKYQISLLGRRVNFTGKLYQCLYKDVVKSLDTVLTYFECRGATALVTLDHLISQNRLAYQLMTEDAAFDFLGDFDVILSEVMNVQTNVTTYHEDSGHHNRVTMRTFWQLTYHILPTYTCDLSLQRLVPTTTNQTNNEFDQRDEDLWGSHQLKVAYNLLLRSTEEALDGHHLRCLCNLAGYGGLCALLWEIRKIIRGLVEKCVEPAIQRVQQLYPVDGLRTEDDVIVDSADMLSHYVVALRNIIRSSELIRAFQGLAKLGNVLIFCKLLENALGQEETLDLIAMSRLKPRRHDLVNTNSMARRNTLKSMKTKADESLVSPGPSAIFAELKRTGFSTDPKLDKLMSAVDLLSRERLCLGLSFYSETLNVLRDCLTTSETWMDTPSSLHHAGDSNDDDDDDDDEGDGNADEAGRQSNNNNNNKQSGSRGASAVAVVGFGDLWPALVFVMACRPAAKNDTCKNIKDEWRNITGILLAGQTLVYSLDQHHTASRQDICKKICQATGQGEKTQVLNDFIQRATEIRIQLEQISFGLEKSMVDLKQKKESIPGSYIPPPIHPFYNESRNGEFEWLDDVPF